MKKFPFFSYLFNRFSFLILSVVFTAFVINKIDKIWKDWDWFVVIYFFILLPIIIAIIIISFSSKKEDEVVGLTEEEKAMMFLDRLAAEKKWQKTLKKKKWIEPEELDGNKWFYFDKNKKVVCKSCGVSLSSYKGEKPMSSMSFCPVCKSGFRYDKYLKSKP